MSRHQFLSAALVVGCLAGFSPQLAEAQDVTTERIATGFSQPLYVCSPPGDTDRLFVVQQRGLIRIIDLTTNTTLSAPFLSLVGVVSSSGNERGLLGMAFHPDYATNDKFYVSYTANAGGASHVVEYTVSADPNVANSTPGPTIFSIGQPFSNHNGGCIQFGPDGKLYVGMGDGGSANDPGNRAQNLDNNLGKMLRFDVDIPSPYIPNDNPFVGIAGNDEIWAYGLRNPWRFSFDRDTGDMYIGDVGQNAWEEVDFQPASSTGGENYGWRCREGAHNFNTGGCPPVSTMVDPIQEYSHSLGCSISGGYVYRGDAIPGLSGTYFYADYCSNRIWSLRYDGANVTEFMLRSPMNPPVGFINSITSFGEDGAGEMYIVDQGGEIYKIVEDIPPCMGTVASYCVAAPNSNGPQSGTELFASGSTNIADNTFQIDIGGGILGNFGIFFYGLGPAQVMNGNGFVCVDLSQGLYRVYPVVQIDPLLGTGFKVFDFNAPPMDSGPSQIVPGTTYYFQFWYRDPAGSPTDFNFSNALMATFCP